VEEFVPDTADLYSIDISKNKRHLFTNLDFCLSLTNDGRILSTDMTAENQSASVFATMAGFAFNSTAPLVNISKLRGAKDTSENARYLLAAKLLDSLKVI
jgi:hypothetical protein